MMGREDKASLKKFLQLTSILKLFFIIKLPLYLERAPDSPKMEFSRIP
jgi:hypothetical protein